MIGMFMLNPPRAKSRTRRKVAGRRAWWLPNKKTSIRRVGWAQGKSVAWSGSKGASLKKRPSAAKKSRKPRKSPGIKRGARPRRSPFAPTWSGLLRTRSRKGWRGEGKAHAVAAKIGWTYRKYARDFRKFSAYAARGTGRGKFKGLTISARSLKLYRSQRRTPLSRLEGRREWFKHRTTKKKTYAGAMSKAKRRYGMLYNASSYQKFVGKFVKGAKSRAEARRRFKAAAKAWKRRKGGKSKSRRSRSNPVLPISYSNPGRKRRKARRSRSNPLFRTAAGRFAKRGGRKLRRISGGGWHANSPILPYTAYSNPVAAITGTFKEMADVSMWTRTIIPLTAGYLGTHALSLAAVKMIAPAGTEFKGIVKHGARAVSAALLSVGTGIVTKDSDMAAKVLAGGLVAVLGGILADVIGPDFSKATGLGEMNDLADDLTEDLKARIAEGVRKQFAGIGNDEDDDGSISAFVTTEDLSRAPRLGDFVTAEALRKDTVGSNLPGRASGGPPREPRGNELADLGTFQDALADGSLI